MAKVSPILTAFNAGELSRTIDGRVDLQKYAHGCRRMENFIPLIQGPAQRRGGTRFVSEAADSSERSWMIKFEFSTADAYIIEFSNAGVIRFYKNRSQLKITGLDNVQDWDSGNTYSPGDIVGHFGVLPFYYCHTTNTNKSPPDPDYWHEMPGVVYEIPSPYTGSSLTAADGTCNLRVVQSGDVMYIATADGSHPPRKLIRYHDWVWVLEEYSPSQGPFDAMNTGAITLKASGATGAITLTASANLFSAVTDIGRLVRIESESLSVRPWEVNKSYNSGELVEYAGLIYKALNTKTSGTSPPIHTHGTAYDGQDGVQWEYQHPGYGIVRITGFTSQTVVSAEVVTDPVNGLAMLPADVVSDTTTRWQMGSWYPGNYPVAVTFWANRLWWATALAVFGSVPDDFENFSGDFFGEVSPDASIWRYVLSQDVNRINWISGADKLLIGTNGGEFVGGPLTESEPIGPGNFAVKRQSNVRSRGIQPVLVGTSACYVQRAGKKLISTTYAIQNDAYVAQDLAVLADRVTRSGIVSIAYQGEPHSIIWCALASGGLRGFTYEAQQDVMGWHRHDVGGAVECVATIPTPDGTADDLWMIVRREINGNTVRYVEYMERAWEGADEDGTPGDAPEDAFYVDCGITYDGTATATITGLDHLEGEEVAILADGATHPNRTVVGGQISLQRAASVVQVGLPMVSRLVSMRLEVPTPDGTSQGKTKRIHIATVRFLDTLGGKVGLYGRALEDISLRYPETPMDTPPDITSGDHVLSFPGDYESDGLIEIRQDQPLPMTVVAIMPEMRTY